MQLFINKNLSVLVDEIDHKWASQHGWEVTRSKYSSHIRRTVNKNSKRIHYSFATEIMERIGFKKEPEEYIRFVNGNQLDYRRDNLVLIDKSLYHQRQLNAGLWHGVCQKKGVKSYSINIRLDKKTSRNFKTAPEAALTYNKLAVTYYGQFAAINATRHPKYQGAIYPPLVLVEGRRIRKPDYGYQAKNRVAAMDYFDDVARWCPHCVTESCFLVDQGLKCFQCRWLLSPRSVAT
jgi:hypothetical protein